MTWNAITGSPVTVTSGQKLYVWWAKFSTDNTAPSIQSSSDHVCGGLTGFYNCAFSPINNQETGTETSSDTSFSFATTISTDKNNCLILAVCSVTADSNTGQFSAEANANLTSIAERQDFCTNSGAGGGFCVMSGFLATAGAIGTWTATLGTACTKSYLTLALQPADDFTRTITDYIGELDSNTRLKELFRPFTELLGAYDIAATRIMGYVRTFTEYLGKFDTILHEKFGGVTDYFHTVEEIFGGSDSVSRLKSVSKSMTELLGGLDSLTKSSVKTRNVIEYLGALDTRIKLKFLTRNIIEYLGNLDTITKFKLKYVTFTEKLGESDSYQRVKTLYRSFTEALGKVDEVLHQLFTTGPQAFVRTITEKIGFDEDAYDSLKTIFRNFVEYVGYLDTKVSTKTLFRIFTEMIGELDSILHNTGAQINEYFRTITESIGFYEGVWRDAWNYMLTGARQVETVLVLNMRRFIRWTKHIIGDEE